MSDLHVGKAPPLLIVLPFYATGALFFLVLTVLLFLSANDLTGHFFSPHLLAIVHTAALGWATMIIFGATYELLPVLCENSLYSKRLAIFSYVFLLGGIAQLVPAFWSFSAGTRMITGGSFVFLATLCYVLNVLLTASAANKKELHQTFLITSSLWLLVTVTLGLTLAVNLRYPFMTRNHLEIMKLHAHVGLGGWFLQLITGVSIKLVPMFLVSRPKKTTLPKIAWVLQNGALALFLLDGHLLGSGDRDLVYAVISGLGIAAWLGFINDARVSRLRKRIDIPMKLTLSSFVFLAAAVLLIPVVQSSTQPKWALMYGTLLFLGWLTSLMLGQTFKTLPFIVWNDITRKQHQPAKGALLPKDLYSESILTYQHYLYYIALSSLLAGMLLGNSTIILVALAVWVMVALLYLINVCKILFQRTIITHEN
ncbi:MAG: hypothetical protein BGO21_14145 [Dyadobacter sp. 50-39]|uniref:hypothetical protein n=1 Tax=Dyadobacter sp. 50-39 TaxID=1895756 RepID=UPI000962DF29|nr:hypothetical protein [Dyadobacter sp. 50-39]OJV22507.1 MAG: hypothetical protein BGO21_14145 [Dyadobacter sp. 50-39]